MAWWRLGLAVVLVLGAGFRSPADGLVPNGFVAHSPPSGDGSYNAYSNRSYAHQSVAQTLACEKQSSVGTAHHPSAVDVAGSCTHQNAPLPARNTTAIAIQDVPLGARVPDQNPRPEDWDFSLAEVDPATWRRIDFRVHRNDGSTMDTQLLRPVEWIVELGLKVGDEVTLVLDETEAGGKATVTSIGPCPEISRGEGSVVVGRFITRDVGKLFEVTLTDGTTFTGTSTHPIWSVDRQDWIDLAELNAGEQLDTPAGPVTITTITPLHHTSDVYNLEVHTHHVYRITPSAILVHNNNYDDVANAGEKIAKVSSATPPRTGYGAFGWGTRPISASGLKGADFEAWILKNRGGTGGFMSGGRQIDGKLPDGTWYEAKSAFNYLFSSSGTLNTQKWNEFTSQVSFASAQAAKNGGNFKLISNVKPPQKVVDWLIKRGIAWEVVD